MKRKHLDAKGKGIYSYDYENDIMLFKIKDREYMKSIDFPNLTVDIDTEGFVTGIRIFDASKIFKLSKVALRNVRNFEFNTHVEDKIIRITLTFIPVYRNKPMLKQAQDFVREALRSKIEDSEVVCTVA